MDYKTTRPLDCSRLEARNPWQSAIRLQFWVHNKTFTKSHPIMDICIKDNYWWQRLMMELNSSEALAIHPEISLWALRLLILGGECSVLIMQKEVGNLNNLFLFKFILNISSLDIEKCFSWDGYYWSYKGLWCYKFFGESSHSIFTYSYQRSGLYWVRICWWSCAWWAIVLLSSDVQDQSPLGVVM